LDLLVPFGLLDAVVMLIDPALVLNFFLLGQHELRLTQPFVFLSVLLKRLLLVSLDDLDARLLKGSAYERLQDGSSLSLKVKNVPFIIKDCGFVLPRSIRHKNSLLWLINVEIRLNFLRVNNILDITERLVLFVHLILDFARCILRLSESRLHEQGERLKPVFNVPNSNNLHCFHRGWRSCLS
jgi:hypothetical protein